MGAAAAAAEHTKQVQMQMEFLREQAVVQNARAEKEYRQSMELLKERQEKMDEQGDKLVGALVENAQQTQASNDSLLSELENQADEIADEGAIIDEAFDEAFGPIQTKPAFSPQSGGQPQAGPAPGYA